MEASYDTHGERSVTSPSCSRTWIKQSRIHFVVEAGLQSQAESHSQQKLDDTRKRCDESSMSLRSSRVSDRHPDDSHLVVEEHKGHAESTRGLQAYNPAVLNNSPCQNLEIIDACWGTPVWNNFTRTYVPYQGTCDGDFYDDLSIYYSAEKKLYMYALDKYPEDWSNEAVQGLVRWRVASFVDSGDTTTCRYEEANLNQFDFAADGQPYNYYPAVYCYDENANGQPEYRSSTITILCNDIVVRAAIGTGSDEHGDWSALAISFSVAGNIVLLVILLGVCFWVRRSKQSRESMETKEAQDREKDGLAFALEEGKPKELECRSTPKAQLEAPKETEPRTPSKETWEAYSRTIGSPRTTPTDSEEVDTSEEERVNNSRTVPESVSKELIGEEETSGVPKDILSMVAKLDNYFEANDSGSDIYFDASESGGDMVTPSTNKKRSKGGKGRSRSGKRHGKRGRSRPVDHRDEKEHLSRGSSVGKMAQNNARNYSTGPLPKSRSLSRKRGVKDDYCKAGSVTPGGGDNLSRSKNKDNYNPAPRPSTSRSEESNSGAGNPESPGSVPWSRSLSRSRNTDNGHRHKCADFSLNSAAVLHAIPIPAGPDSVPRSRTLNRTTHKNYSRAPRGNSPFTQDDVKPDNDRLQSSLDEPHVNLNVEKQPDGSVLVIQKRTRDDGAVVTTKTKYANSTLAKKHGIDLN